jgi:hypothetical protein
MALVPIRHSSALRGHSVLCTSWMERSSHWRFSLMGCCNCWKHHHWEISIDPHREKLGGSSFFAFILSPSSSYSPTLKGKCWVSSHFKHGNHLLRMVWHLWPSVQGAQGTLPALLLLHLPLHLPLHCSFLVPSTPGAVLWHSGEWSQPKQEADKTRN